jgi:teichuronic acid biosynthesis glycosyltransferase TuaC
MANIQIFAEEYTKVTKGTFLVWLNYIRVKKKKHRISILLNKEHWINEKYLKTLINNNIAFKKLPFLMPSTFLKLLMQSINKILILRALRFLLGQVINIITLPLILIYLIIYLRTKNLDAIFCHNGGWPGGVLCRWIIIAAKFAGVRKRVLVIHSHPSEHGFFLKPLRLLQACIIDFFSTEIVTVSDSVKKVLSSKVFKSKIIRIYNGIHFRSLNNNSNRNISLNWKPKKIAIGYLGALSFNKGCHILIKAFKKINLPCELAFMGPSEKECLIYLQKQAKLCKNKVSFLNFHEDVDSFLGSIDVLVVPSIAYESFGIVILEAMKHSKPVICSDFGGMKEVVNNDITGLVVPNGDVLALAQGLRKLLKNKKMRIAMGKAGYKRLANLFRAEQMAREYDKIIL